MSADEKVKRVFARIGVWTPGQKCEGAIAFASSSNPDAMCLCGRKGIKGPYDDGIHDIPCPDPSDPAIIVAMLEWLLYHCTCISRIYGPNYDHYCVEADYEHHGTQGTRGKGTTLHEALIGAIDALPED